MLEEVFEQISISIPYIAFFLPKKSHKSHRGLLTV